MESILSELMPLFEEVMMSVSQYPVAWGILAMVIVGITLRSLWKIVEGLIGLALFFGLAAGFGWLIEWLFPGLILWLFTGGLETVFWYVGVTIAAVFAIAVVAVVIAAFFSDDESDTEEPTNTLTLEKERK